MFMIKAETMVFLGKLKKNNNREWFAKNKNNFEAAKSDFDNFITALIGELGKINPALKGQLSKDVVFRIYRDVRFSKNKDPYKQNLGAYICEGGKKSNNPGFYIQIQPGGESFAAGGCWMPDAANLKKIRQEISYHTPAFKKIIGNKNFIGQFHGLSDVKVKTVPRGFKKDDPDIELFKYTSYVVQHQFSDHEVQSKDFIKKNVDLFKVMFPLLTFLKRGME